MQEAHLQWSERFLGALVRGMTLCHLFLPQHQSWSDIIVHQCRAVFVRLVLSGRKSFARFHHMLH